MTTAHSSNEHAFRVSGMAKNEKEKEKEKQDKKQMLEPKRAVKIPIGTATYAAVHNNTMCSISKK